MVGSNNLSTEVSGEITECGCFPGALTKVGTGTLTLAATGLYSYTGPTVVAGGTLIVNGDLTSSSKVTVLPGARSAGLAQLARLDRGRHAVAWQLDRNLQYCGPALVHAGELLSASRSIGPSPTSPMSPAPATLAGTVQVSSPTGAYKFNSPYTILSAVGGLVGQFNAVTGTYVTGVVNNVGNDVLLTLSSNLRGSAGGGLNQQNVAAALDRGFNIAGNNAGFEALFLLPPGSLPNAMSQLSGEVATAVGPAGLEAMSQFLKLMLDPFAGTRGEAGGGPALGFAPGAAGVQGSGQRLRRVPLDPQGACARIVRAALDHLGGGLRQHQQRRAEIGRRRQP